MAFFEPTARYEEANRELYVVVNAAQASLELAAAEAAALHAANPGWTRPQIREVMFPGYHARGIKIDVHESLLDRTVEDNWRTLAGFALITIVARYEAWLDDVVGLAPAARRVVTAPPGCRPNTRGVAQALQFPTASANPPHWMPGCAAGLAALAVAQDARLARSITPILHRAYGTDRTYLRPLLTTYRHFKEIRNGLAHGHGRASKFLATISQTTQRYTAATLGVKGLPSMPRFRTGDDVSLTIRDVVLFDAVVTRIVRTFDAEMASHGRDEIVQRTRAFVQGRESLPRDAEKRARRLRRMISWVAQAGTDRAGGLRPTPAELRAFERFVVAEGLVT